MRKLFKENDLVKVVTIAILLTVVLTWIIPGGSYNGTEFVKGELTRTGLSELALSVIYSVSFFLQQIIFVLIVGAFYGVISKTNGYKKIVINIAKFIEGKEIVAVVLSSLLFAVMASMISQTFITFIFVPMVISALLKAGIDKKVAFASTFGSILIGILGATYGTEGLYYFNYYMGQDLTKTVSSRFIVLGAAFVIFNLFNVLYMKKAKKTKTEEKVEDKFEVEEPNRKKVNVWPMVILLVITLAVAVLGYVRWEEQFKITCFNDFHNWITGLKIGKTPVLSYILGKTAAFGTWELYSILFVLLIVALASVIIYRVKLDDVLDGVENGIKQMVKPVFLMVLGYSIFVLIYWSPIIPTMVNSVISKDFNVFTSSIAGFISSVFTADFGYTGYTIGGFMTAAYTSNMKEVAVIFPAMHGLTQIIAPTSVILLAGLAYTNVSYKEWMKYIWKFALAVLAVLIIIFLAI